MDLSSFLTAKRLENVTVLDKTDSTNTQLKKMNDAKHGTVIIANEQTAGRGRYNRRFHSPKGGLYLSYLYVGKSSDTVYLTAVCGVIVKRAIERVCGVNLGIKWVNDLLLNGKKVCGILAETVYTGEKHRTVIGLGINCGDKNSIFPDEIKDVATSVYNETGIIPDKRRLCSEIIKMLDGIDTLDRDEIFKEYKKNCITLGKKVRAVSQESTCDGEILGINPDFSLEFLSENGEKKRIYTGEISVKQR